MGLERRTSMRLRVVACALAAVAVFAPVAANADDVPIITAPPTTSVPSPDTTIPPLPDPTIPVPTAPADSGSGRRIVYCVTCQQVWHVNDDNTVARTFLVSGKVATPHSGTYHVFSKSRVGTAGSLRLPYMTRFAHGRSLAIGFHAIPIDRAGRPIEPLSQLGTYRSHGCVRQSPDDALATWNFAPVGTTVVVI